MKFHKIILTFILIFILPFSSFSFQPSSFLFVAFDAGETSNFIPVMTALKEENRPFKILVMGTAETLVPESEFRVTLADLGSDEVVDRSTKRTYELSQKSLTLIQNAFNPEKVIVGTASSIQAQVITLFPHAKSYAFVDNLNYDPQHENFLTVCKVYRAASTILFPAKFTEKLFPEREKPSVIVGKPSLEVWEKEIDEVDLNKLNLQLNGKPVILFVGGYGEGYEVINPFFEECREKLQTAGYNVIIQPHPKVKPSKIKITEALALCKKTGGVVIGYNSSVPLDAALIGIHALYMNPDGVKPFQHFPLIGSVKTCEDLLERVKHLPKPKRLMAELAMPENSVETFLQSIL